MDVCSQESRETTTKALVGASARGADCDGAALPVPVLTLVPYSISIFGSDLENRKTRPSRTGQGVEQICECPDWLTTVLASLKIYHLTCLDNGAVSGPSIDAVVRTFFDNDVLCGRNDVNDRQECRC